MSVPVSGTRYSVRRWWQQLRWWGRSRRARPCARVVDAPIGEISRRRAFATCTSCISGFCRRSTVRYSADTQSGYSSLPLARCVCSCFYLRTFSTNARWRARVSRITLRACDVLQHIVREKNHREGRQTKEKLFFSLSRKEKYQSSRARQRKNAKVISFSQISHWRLLEEKHSRESSPCVCPRVKSISRFYLTFSLTFGHQSRGG